jgi:hypothetical protein
MFNSDTYFGTDGVLTLSDPVGVPGETFTGYFGESGTVGRLKNVTLHASMAIRPFYELGSRAAKELRAGNIAIGGTVERAYINGALLKLMLGEYAENQESTGFRIPMFNMKLTLDNMKIAGEEGNSVLTVYGVIFSTWQFDLPEDDFVLEKLNFQAHRIAVEDKPLPG